MEFTYPAHPGEDATGERLAAVLRRAAESPLPAGWTARYRERRDAVARHTHRDVVICPPGVVDATFTFGQPGGYAHIGATAGGGFILGCHFTNVGFNVQAAGHVVFYRSAHEVVRSAVDELTGELRRQQRGW